MVTFVGGFMSRFTVRVLAVCLLVATGNSFAVIDAHSAVQKATDELLTRLVEIQPLFETNPDEFYSTVDATLGSFVDFEGFSKGVMAKYFRRATDAQKEQFVSSFRQGLIQTYAKALIEFDNQEVLVLKPTTPQKKPDRAAITLEIHSKDAKVYKVDYTLVLIDEDWKLRNLTINGINIGLQFRSQFAAAMQKNNNDIDEVIAHWSVDV
ncbi:MAG: ABC transporter substrate-binding protein [bacterium]|nr:ABC transporter substrate-binding protein [Gammaproteobacteria bacterium]HIL98679.1 ABC transporter substrate-binding protein [Pseudomonadales bacterium]